MNVNENACCLDKPVAFRCFASKLAPTHAESDSQVLLQKQLLPWVQLLLTHFYSYS